MKIIENLWILGICLVGFFIGQTLVLSYFVIGKYGISESIISGYVSGIGSLMGGIVGGLVAFGVSRAQIMNERAERKDGTFKNYRNIVKSIKTEISHNKSIIELIKTKEQSEHDLYITQIEIDIWEKVKFDMISFLEPEVFDILNETYRDYKDLQEKTLPEYQSGNVDYDLRIKTIDTINSKLDNILEKLDSKIRNDETKEL